MSNLEVKVPQLAESISEATLLNWRKKEGDFVKEDEVLIEVETDKVILQVVAIKDGKLNKILACDGALVTSNQVIAYLDTDAKADPKVDPKVDNKAENKSENKSNNKTETSPNLKNNNSDSKDNDIKVMPAAQRLLTENNLSAQEVSKTKSEQTSRLSKTDVVNYVEQKLSTSSPVKNNLNENLEQTRVNTIQLSNNDRSQERVPMTKLRAKIAQRLLESQANNAILTTFNEVDMSCVINCRKKYQEKFEKEHKVKLGFMSFFVKAAVYALKKFPILNASVEGNNIVYHNYFDIGVAVSAPRGLVVPILRNVEKMSFADIEKQIVNFGNLAKEGKLTLEDLSGGTFTISNGGVFGSMLSTPIINPPQSAILGVHATKDRPVAENGQVVIRPMNYLALSYDHRIIDGKEAVLGLVAMKEALEDPIRLLLD